MIDHRANVLALRGRALTLAGPTTGSATLSVTATGYARASGSFLTDGFSVGMEITASGFSESANNGTGVITSVTALAMAVTPYTITAAATADGYTYAERTFVVEASAAARTLSVGLPAMRSYTGKAMARKTGIPYAEEFYVPGPMRKITVGPLGELEADPLYGWRFYVPDNSGLTALEYGNLFVEHFAPSLPLTVGTDTLRVRTDVAPFPAELLHVEGGWSVVSVSVPCRLRTANSR